MFVVWSVVGAAAPRIPMATFLKQTFLAPYFWPICQAVSGGRVPLKTLDHMSQKGPSG